MAKLNLILKAFSPVEIIMLENSLCREQAYAVEHNLDVPVEFKELLHTFQQASVYARFEVKTDLHRK